ncbi:MAG TPA: hypothetical protein VHI78_02595 [Bacteroidales bacterium]|jgi:hypothetical protein|nr:hypothetical protein [Bacteroidales bacterium]
MKKFLPIISILFILFAFSASAAAQCKGFAKKLCKLELQGYIHDGNYHAAILTEGEEAELYKTFYSGQNYRLAICGSEALPAIEFQVVDAYKNVLFDNKEHELSGVWDFTLESSQQLKVVVKVPVSAQKSEFPNSGCVAIMFGFQEK